MKITFSNLWYLEANYTYIQFFSLNWQFDEDWKGICIVLFNFELVIEFKSY